MEILILLHPHFDDDPLLLQSPCLLLYEGIEVQLIGGNGPNEILPSVSSNGLSWSHRDMMDYTITVI